MKTYFIIVLLNAVLIICGNTAVMNFLNLSFLEILLVTLIGIIVMFALDGIIALLVHDFPKIFFKNYKTKTKFYTASNFPFKVYKFEKKIYNKIGIKNWKDFLPSKMGMDKRHVYGKNDLDYLNMFLIESCRAETLHTLSAILSLLLPIFSPFKYIAITLPVCIVNIMLQILPVFVLRYNRPKLISLIKLNERKALNIQSECILEHQLQ